MGRSGRALCPRCLLSPPLSSKPREGGRLQEAHLDSSHSGHRGGGLRINSQAPHQLRAGLLTSPVEEGEESGEAREQGGVARPVGVGAEGQLCGSSRPMSTRGPRAPAPSLRAQWAFRNCSAIDLRQRPASRKGGVEGVRGSRCAHRQSPTLGQEGARPHGPRGGRGRGGPGPGQGVKVGAKGSGAGARVYSRHSILVK